LEGSSQLEKEGWLSLRKLAQAFWTQARADYATATSLLDAGTYYASVFFSLERTLFKCPSDSSIEGREGFGLPVSIVIVITGNSQDGRKGIPLHIGEATTEGLHRVPAPLL